MTELSAQQNLSKNMARARSGLTELAKILSFPANTPPRTTPRARPAALRGLAARTWHRSEKAGAKTVAGFGHLTQHPARESEGAGRARAGDGSARSEPSVGWLQVHV